MNASDDRWRLHRQRTQGRDRNTGPAGRSIRCQDGDAGSGIAASFLGSDRRGPASCAAAYHAIGQIGGTLYEVERSGEIEGIVDRSQVVEVRCLRELDKGQAMTGIIGIEQVACKARAVCDDPRPCQLLLRL